MPAGGPDRPWPPPEARVAFRAASPTLCAWALALAALLWSLNGPLIKSAHLPGITIAFYRSALGGLVLLPWAWARRGTLRAAAPARLLGAVGLFTVMTACFVVATTLTAASTAILLQYTAPVWVVLLSAVFLRERPVRADFVALALALVGVGVMCSGQVASDGRALAIALLSGLAFGALIVALRGLRQVDPLALTALNTLGSALLLAPLVAAGPGLRLSGEQFGLLLLLGVVQFTLPYVLFCWAVRGVEANRAALIVLLEAVFNPILTWTFVGEPVPATTLLGGPLVLGGAALRVVARSAPAAGPSAP